MSLSALESMDSLLSISQSQRKRPQGSHGQLEKKQIWLRVKITNESQEYFYPLPFLSPLLSSPLLLFSSPYFLVVADEGRELRDTRKETKPNEKLFVK